MEGIEMGHKIFVSYKYADSDVRPFSNNIFLSNTVRDYVDKLETYINNSDHIYKGESDGEDLSKLSEDTIWEKLKNRIYDSSLTIVMISPHMKEAYKKDRDQWIPWEISYSLKEVSRKNSAGNYVNSASNAILAIVLPDRINSYSYFIVDNNCCGTGCRTLLTDTLFQILHDNMFNIKKPDCAKCTNNRQIYHGESSYVLAVKWDDFIQNPEEYIDRAYKIQNSIEQYDVVKELS